MVSSKKSKQDKQEEAVNEEIDKEEVPIEQEFLDKIQNA